MSFYADLHIHSRFSRATSRDCNLVELSYWARRKGISVVGTGDFTHPEWRRELADGLVRAEPGLFRLSPGVEKEIEKRLRTFGPPPAAMASVPPTRFILQVEISTIYKKGDRTRKVHHVIYAPDLDTAANISARLDAIGNITSDGRPILGLDSRNLLEIVLEAGAGAYLIPAHIWTPWFSVLGSKSGFDTIEECYDDLAEHIFAVETGLSSDPSMNWRLSALDKYRLVSNSDAHSPAKLGRESCVFETDMDYHAMRHALETGERYGGTVELFPEEGKYHLDGHRKCEARLTPGETKAHDGRCPVCGKPVTVGVMHRVDDLADRVDGARPEGADPFRSLIPLPEILSEILGVGPQSKKVRGAYDDLLARLGPELCILEQLPADDLCKGSSSLMAEAITRMREGRVIRQAGYDGEYGVIRLFEEGELRGRKESELLFSMPEAPARDKEARRKKKADSSARSQPEPSQAKTVRERPREPAESSSIENLKGLDPEQRAAAEIVHGPLLIVAGPGTGKTRTLTHRIAYLVTEHDVDPQSCLAVTFTNRAAGEMSARLADLIPEAAASVPVMTFHALGYRILRECAGELGLPADARIADEEERLALIKETLNVSGREGRRLLNRISDAKRSSAEPPEEAGEYVSALRERGLLDFDDLIALPVRLFDGSEDLVADYRDRFWWLSVDEYQDIDSLQYRLLRFLAPRGSNLCVIGDPDQSIYGFRGSDVGHFQRFTDDYPEAKVVHLTRNYRSTRTIVDASLQAILPTTLVSGRRLIADTPDESPIVTHTAATEKAEAEFVVHTIEQLIGGSTFFSMDSGRVASHESGGFSFADFAVLYRADAQAAVLIEAFVRSGMPFQKRSHLRLNEDPMVRRVLEEIRGMGEEMPTADRLVRVLDNIAETDLSGDFATVCPLLERIARKSSDFGDFESRLAMGDDIDLWDPRADRVSLMTLHAAKGLEFPVVFVVGCEDGLLPLYWDRIEECNLAEERRLFFVGMTRARSRLYLSHAQKRVWRGKQREMKPSGFLNDIEERLLELSRSHGRRARRKPQGAQLDLF